MDELKKNMLIEMLKGSSTDELLVVQNLITALVDARTGIVAEEFNKLLSKVE